jgi:hypothetical protein
LWVSTSTGGLDWWDGASGRWPGVGGTREGLIMLDPAHRAAKLVDMASAAGAKLGRCEHLDD